MKKLIFALLLLCASLTYAQQVYELTSDGPVQYFNNAGTTPLAGGKLYTYAAGTLTPLVTYSNSDGTQNTNPVILDSTGRAVIYRSSASYKFILKTSADVTIWTRDNIQSAGLNAISNFNHTQNTVAKFGGSQTLATSRITDDGTTVNIGVANSLGGALSVAGDGSNYINLSQATADGFGPIMFLLKSRGTHAAPLDVQNGDNIFNMVARAYSGSSFFSTAQISMSVDGTFTSNQAPPSRILFATNAANASSTTQMRIDSTGLVTLTRSMLVGAATGGDKGAGTINTSADIYKNNTAFTSPDFVFEHYYSGSIVKFKNNSGAANYHGLMSLAEVEQYARANYQLPDVGSTHGMFERGDVLLRHTEELYLHLFELQHRIDSLESRISQLEAK